MQDMQRVGENGVFSLHQRKCSCLCVRLLWRHLFNRKFPFILKLEIWTGPPWVGGLWRSGGTIVGGGAVGCHSQGQWSQPQNLDIL